MFWQIQYMQAKASTTHKASQDCMDLKQTENPTKKKTAYVKDSCTCDVQ